MELIARPAPPNQSLADKRPLRIGRVAAATPSLAADQAAQIAGDLCRLPLISAIKLHQLTVRSDHRGAQRVDYLFLPAIGVMVITEPKELCDAFDFILRTRGEFPMLKIFV